MLKMQMEQLERLNGAHKELDGLGGSLSMAGLAHEAQREMSDPKMVREVLFITGALSLIGLLLYLRGSVGDAVGGVVGMTPRKNASHIV